MDWTAALDKKWAVANELSRYLLLPFARMQFFLHGVAWRNSIKVYGLPIIQKFRGSSIEIGEFVQLRSSRMSNPLVPLHPVVLATRSRKARISIGAYTGITGAMIVATDAVSIGSHVSIGSNATLVDSDFHPLDPVLRRTQSEGGISKAIVIEDDAFIGMNVLILKGVRIGRGAVVGAGSVVTRSVPSMAVVVGNPAKVVRYLA